MSKRKTGIEQSTGQGNSNSKNTNTGTTTIQNGRSDGGSEGKSNTEISKETVVESPLPNYAPIEIGSETTSSEIVKPKRKYKKRNSKKEEKNSSEDIQKLLEGVFSVISLKAGQHWQLSPSESKQIADPLSNILEKHNLLEKAESMSDGVALIVACISIVLPRILISKMNKPKKIKEVLKNNGAIKTEAKITKSVESGKSEISTTTKSTSDDGDSNKRIKSGLSEYVSSISPNIYG